MSLTLADLNVNEKGEIETIKASGEIRRRLLDMGIVRGVRFKVLRKAPLGDPVEIFLKGFNLSLRLNEARNILVRRIGHVGDHRPMGRKHRFGFGRFGVSKKDEQA